MASFCSKCGAPIPAGNQFCSACGAASCGPSSGPGAASAQPVAAPVSSGSSAIKIILIVVAVFVGLGVVGAGIFGYGVWRISRAVHVSGDKGQVTINTPGGAVTANSQEKFTASELGAEIYPGAKPGRGNMRMNLPNGSMVTATFVTSDTKDQVLAFYKAKFGSAATVIESGDGAVVTLPRGQQEAVIVTITPKSTEPRSSENDGKTTIAIMHTRNNKPT